MKPSPSYFTRCILIWTWGCSEPSQVTHKKSKFIEGQLYLRRKLRRLSWIFFYQSVESRVLFYSVVCSIKEKYAKQLAKLVRRASLVVDMELEFMLSLAERRTLSTWQHVINTDLGKDVFWLCSWDDNVVLLVSQQFERSQQVLKRPERWML